MNLQQRLDAATPLLLLPARIETRFVDTEISSNLLVRIYPDQISVFTHEPDLTADEVRGGTAYWTAIWLAGLPTPQATLQDQWRKLATSWGAPRAAWVAKTMRPTNFDMIPNAPTPLGTPPNPAPVFPAPPVRDSSWTAAATVELLPDAWTVVLYAGTQVAVHRTEAVATPLNVGLTPGDSVRPDGLPVDDGMRWMVDFDRAASVGMALSIPLTTAQRQSGFDRIIVYGVRTKDGKTDAVAFSDLLDAHHYTDGFALIPQGAPTNNTSDASSAYVRKDFAYDESLSVETLLSLTSDPQCDGVVFRQLLGLSDGLLDHVKASGGFGVRNARDMMTALWPSTLGYFMNEIMASVFTSAQIEAAREYAIANAVSRGPLPAFRVGKIPYGVLPALSLQLEGQDFSPAARPLLAGLRRLLPYWQESIADAPRVAPGADPEAQLMSVLGMDASSMTFQGRRVFGDEFFWNYLIFMGWPNPALLDWFRQYITERGVLFDALGYTAADPRLLHMLFDQGQFPVPYATVQDGPLSESDGLHADASFDGGMINYISWLRYANINDVRSNNYPYSGPARASSAPTSLLYRILRQSVLLEYVTLAARAEIEASNLSFSNIRDTEIIGVDPASSAITPWQLLQRPSIPAPQVSWADYLFALSPTRGSAFERLGELRASLERLSALSTAELDRLLTETLDACSHRLDVWITSLATAKLQEVRASGNGGLHVGSFSWVEDVRPASDERGPVTGAERERVLRLDRSRQATLHGGVQLAPVIEPHLDNGGFIHAPSIAQAAVAAVLRNGYMTHRATAEEGVLSIDLSSERVSRALWYLSGIRQGQSLSALLGFRFEEGLHAAKLDVYVQPFRDRFPLVGTQLTAASEPSESITPNVVDALALRQAWDNGKLDPAKPWGDKLPGPGDDQKTVIKLLEDLDDTMSALGDVAMAEGVYQVARGNFDRASALTDAVSKGKIAPEPEVVRTPRGGLDFTHRVMIIIGDDVTLKVPWDAIAATPRALAAPRLNAWLSTMLPDPTTVAAQVGYVAKNGTNHQSLVRLSDLGLAPVDVLELFAAAEVPQRSELELRLLHAAAVPADATKIALVFDAASLPPATLTFPLLLAYLGTLRHFVGAARALEFVDLLETRGKTATGGGALDLPDLNARALAARTALVAAVQALDDTIAGKVGSKSVSDALFACAGYGAPGAVPPPDAPDALLALAQSTSKTLHKRVDAASTPVLPATSAAGALSVLHEVFGKGFIVLPRFTLNDVATPQAAFAASPTLVVSDTTAPAWWLQQLSSIRPNIARLDDTWTLAQIVAGIQRPEFVIGQIPAVPKDTWLALQQDPATLVSGRVAMEAYIAGNPFGARPITGLLVDEWPERIPSSQEQAAVSFHYEEPKARAPQSLILALAPQGREVWDDETLLATVSETLELAKIRCVDVAGLRGTGSVLPALYFPFNLEAATVSMELFEVNHAAVNHVNF